MAKQEKSPQDATSAAISYLRRGWQPIPIRFGEKAPRKKRWQHLRLAETDVSRHFSLGENVGVLLGEPSGGLVDVDLDSAEALVLAPYFLPATRAIFGRRSKPRSHWLYVGDPLTKTEKFADIDGVVVVELRSTGCQTVFPPSTHSGERVAWDSDGEPAKVDGKHLRDRTAKLAAAALLARHWPVVGSRQEAALALAGGLLGTGWKEQSVRLFIQAVATAASDEETVKRAKAAEYTARRLADAQATTGWRRLGSLMGREVVSRALRWLNIQRKHGRNAAGSAPGPSVTTQNQTQAQQLVALVRPAELFHTPAGEAYASVPVRDHRECWPVRSDGFRRWLRHLFYRRAGKPPGTQALEEAIHTLEARAYFDGAEQEVFIRVARLPERLIIDLCNPKWEVVEVTAEGWHVLTESPVRFRRSKGMLPLPDPVAGGSVDELRQFINAPDERNWRLTVGGILGALRGVGPYPILIFQGEAGSAKSTTARLVRAVVDPSVAPSRTAPREERDLVISANNCFVLNFDNLSGIQPWLSDALCRMATGTGFSTRQLYTDADEIILAVARPIILNGIEDLATREDLIDRTIVVPLPPISKEQRRPERELLQAFNEALPRILGAFLDVASVALRNFEKVQLGLAPRMVDFVQWVTAAEPALDWEYRSFIDLYEDSRQEAIGAWLDSPVVTAVRKLLEEQPHWRGTATELLATLNDRFDETVRRGRAWPRTASSLSNKLKRAMPFLRQLGIEVEFRHSGGRTITLRKVAAEAVRPVQGVLPDAVNVDGKGRVDEQVAPDGEKRSYSDSEVVAAESVPTHESSNGQWPCPDCGGTFGTFAGWKAHKRQNRCGRGGS